ncbi:class I SAM-dependent methyltransferase [Acanthopleuribacter pedis]|uniref:Class I SAM-dependent methyltransferase n=1 Tax=Acanthopleuribacter pedis TaxID=442870 RepID=A0A8J7U0V0_9BACT|nr:class I SAM-dependent methyltransferase [Acanthopleuribacter pedis]MBO1316892.1 class I SAM-dependent methyltransferase [Acanthopleuribacter pedis]
MEVTRDMQPYFSGNALYGDDFDLEEIEGWYRDESEGYAGLIKNTDKQYRYDYHALNHQTLFRFLPADRRFQRAMGLGSAYGKEFEPINQRIDTLTVIDPSDEFTATEVVGIPARYIKPNVSGRLPFEDNHFDLITCFGVLHHIPNVSYVLKEMARVLEPGGYTLIREPIVSMGDWRRERPGLTKRERGIPQHLFQEMVAEAGFTVLQRRLVGFAPLRIIWKKTGTDLFSSRLGTSLDLLCSNLFRWNLRYHAESSFAKFRPTSAAYVLTKA